MDRSFRKGKQFSGFGMSDEEHATELRRHADAAHSLLRDATSIISGRKGAAKCRKTHQLIGRATVERAIAESHLNSMVESAKVEYGSLIANLRDHHNMLLQDTASRCGSMVLSSRARRKCIKFGRKVRGRRICKQYRKTKVR